MNRVRIMAIAHGILSRTLMLLVAILTACLGMKAQAAAGEPADSTRSADEAQLDSLRLRDDFVTASMLVTTPGPSLYSALGHAAIRMECPHFGLDICFSYQSMGEPTLTDYIRFFSGQLSAGFIAMKTADYLSVSREEGRGIKQYTLNLTPRQKQELWRRLDNNMMEGLSTQFDFLLHNCTSMSLAAAGSQLNGEHFEVRQWPESMRRDCPIPIFCSATPHTPWMQFVLVTISGSSGDDPDIPRELLVSPETVGEVLEHTVIVGSDGTERPALTGKPQTLMAQTYYEYPTPFTPLWLSAMLLVLVLLLTVGEWRCHWQRAARVADVLLLVGQAVLGLLLAYIVFFGNLYEQHWNWCLLLFSPLPLLVWLCCRRRAAFGRVCLAYGCVLLLLAVVVPLVSYQLLAAHRLLAIAGFVRCLANGTGIAKKR